MMAAREGDQDRSEAATDYKLRKARDRGVIVKSAEVTFAVLLMAGAAWAYGMGDGTLARLGRVMSRGFAAGGRGELSAAAALNIAFSTAFAAAQVAAPLLLMLWICAVLSGAAQARGVFSTQPLKPDFSRLNPAKGLKRLFSLKSLLDLARHGLKLAVMGLAGFLWGEMHLNELVRVQWSASRAQAHTAVDLVASVLAMAAGLFVAFAIIDWLVNGWEYARQMRMSKREVKDEHKERDGDPRVKSRLRELRMEWLKRARSLSNVKSADVLITNPTHFAVALKYRHGEMPAPRVTARGAGEMALAMRRQAARHQVPIVENRRLARALFAVPGTDPFVPEAEFHEVARVLRWVYAARRPGAREAMRP
jgi:flagellar biosynthetic protein FlhB